MRCGGRGLALIAGIGMIALVVAVWAWPGGSPPPARRNEAVPSVSPPPKGAARLAAAGDICSPDPDSCAPTADLVARLQPDAVLPLGDNQYPDGTIEQYLAGYDPTWGRFADITHPVAGNHEWHTPGARGYLAYFDRSSYWYTFEVGGWRLYALDGSCEDNGGCAPGDPQYRWLEAQLAERSDRCILAYWHQPRFSSGTVHGSDARVAPLWRLLDAAGGDVVLNGHEHNYERFAAQDVDGHADADGMVQIVVGTGGPGDGYPFGDPLPTSIVRLRGSGVLELSLFDMGWMARFLRPSGEVADQAEGTC